MKAFWKKLAGLIPAHIWLDILEEVLTEIARRTKTDKDDKLFAVILRFLEHQYGDEPQANERLALIAESALFAAAMRAKSKD